MKRLTKATNYQIVTYLISMNDEGINRNIN